VGEEGSQPVSLTQEAIAELICGALVLGVDRYLSERHDELNRMKLEVVRLTAENEDLQRKLDEVGRTMAAAVKHSGLFDVGR